jgi:ribosomal protein S18 acetylase RimI-like enzyme
MDNRIDFVAVETDQHIESVAQLADQIWHQHFTPIIGLAQVDYMLDKFQSVVAISQQIAREKFHYFLIQQQHNDVGYTGYKFSDNILFLSKLYLLASVRQQGLGRAALEFISDNARKAQASSIRLTVNRYNDATIKTYQHCGFKIVDEVIADIGNGFKMDDYVMEKKILDSRP